MKHVCKRFSNLCDCYNISMTFSLCRPTCQRRFKNRNEFECIVVSIHNLMEWMVLPCLLQCSHWHAQVLGAGTQACSILAKQLGGVPHVCSLGLRPSMCLVVPHYISFSRCKYENFNRSSTMDKAPQKHEQFLISNIRERSLSCSSAGKGYRCE